MIAAFGFCEEPEPGVIVPPTVVTGIHLTRLAQDGGKAAIDPVKIMLSPMSGLPIVLAPVNDGLGLAITEGIEDGLSAFEETGLGVWAAGSAGNMPKIVAALPLDAATWSCGGQGQGMGELVSSGKLPRLCRENSEDDIDEMRRRLAAAARAIQYDQNELRDSFILADDTYEVVLAKFDARSKSLIRTPLFERLVATVLANKIDILFVDPFAETFEGDENSNSELKWACTLWREVARRTSTAICLVHHTKKYASGMAGDVDAARGASALIGVSRIVATLFPMTPAEAELMQISEDQRVHYLRYDDAKANLNLKSPFARWFRKETFTLDNATADLPADDVGALIPWSPPGLMDDISESHIVEFFALVDAGLQDENRAPTGEFYTFSRRKSETVFP